MDLQNKSFIGSDDMNNSSISSKKNIVGGITFDVVSDPDVEVNELLKINNEFWSSVGNKAIGATALPSWGGFFDEEYLGLLGDLSNKKVLDICCGTGHSLQYVHKKGAAELWGIDISQEQIKLARNWLSEKGINAELICSPMEEDCGIPKNYFGLVYSVFGIGWTSDLNRTFSLIHSYLKPGGKFIFNWSHPIHKCTSIENGELVFNNSYYDEGWYNAQLQGESVVMCNRMLSTYINALAENGFVIERLIEKPNEELLSQDDSVFAEKAKIAPVGFVIVCSKSMA